MFSSFRLVPMEHALLDGDKPLRLGSRALNILVVLVERAGQTVPNHTPMACAS